MSSYAEMIQRRRQASALLFKLWTLGLDVRTERCAAGAAGRGIVVEGLRSLNPEHADRLMRLVRESEVELLEILSDEREPGPAANGPDGSGARAARLEPGGPSCSPRGSSGAPSPGSSCRLPGRSREAP